MNDNQFRLDEFDFDKNYIIEASAGTGKTYNVNQIVKKLVNERHIPLSKILIVTYTEKAVGELRSRIRDNLPNEDVDNAPIYTIHSFCKDTLNEFGISANMPLGLEVIDESAIFDFVERYVREGDILNNITKLMELDAGIDIDGLKQKLVDGVKKYYLNKDYQEDSSIVSLEKSDDMFSLYISINEAKSLDEVLANNPDIKFHLNIIKNCESEKGKRFYEELINESTWKNHFNFNGTSFSQRGNDKWLDKNKKYKKDYLTEIEIKEEGEDCFVNEIEAYDFFKKLKESLKSYNATNPLANRYLPDFYKKWQILKEKSKSETFDDMIRYVREAIISQPSFKKALQDKYLYGIIDEFQDTNQRQFDIFSSIFLEDTEKENKHHIIVVGDPKQSIYSFQGADIEVYRNAIKTIQEHNGEFKVLNKNYRSSSFMVNACNQLFHEYFSTDEFKDCDSLKDEVNKIEVEKKEHLMHYKDDFGNVSDKPIWIIQPNEDDSSIDEANNTTDAKKKKTKANQEYSVADMVANLIIDCCSLNADGTSRLLVKGKDDNSFRNVSFKDFTILAMSRPEMKPFESALKRHGIPFIRYKDDSLFKGKECAYWIALLSAIDSPDFVGSNRNLYKKALFTPFFGKSFEVINTTQTNKDDTKEMNLIIEWKQLASEKRWEDMFENILINTNIDKRLRSTKEMQSLSIIKQISKFCINYLSKSHSLSDLIKFLKSFALDNTEGLEQGENIIEKNTDFDSVKIMTMHASKGLQFPVVINVSGYKKPSVFGSSFIYHQTNEETNKKETILTFNLNAIKAKEDEEEKKRLFYVANTRAQFLMILPNYQLDDKNKSFINKSLEKFMTVGSDYYRLIKEDDISDSLDSIINSRQILKHGIKKKNESITIQEQLNKLKELIKEEPIKKFYKHSYTSITHSEDKDDEYGDDEYQDMEGKQTSGLSLFDKKAKTFDITYSPSVSPINLPIDYPKGTYIGTALHEVLQKLNFTKYNSNLDSLISNCFNNQNINSKQEWINSTKEIIENVMNAILIEIQGSEKTNNTFTLSSIDSKNKKAEMEFDFNLKERFKNYCNGFIDLLFKRGEYYSIVDWKSDSLKEEVFTSYSSKEELKKHTDDSYSIQRVLYSYCLIKALKQDYPDLSEEEIFQSHFGGIYYIYIKGCNKGTSNGIYCQTWDSYKDLKDSFDTIIKKKVGK